MFELFSYIMYFLWVVWNLPLIVLYVSLIKFSFLFQRWYGEKVTIPTPILKIFFKLDNYIIREITETFPKNLLEWLNPYLDEKTKGDIMRALTPNKLVDYVCKTDQKLPVEEQTVFKLRPLKVSETADLRDKMYQVSGTGKGRRETFRTGSMEVEALLKGLRGWENLRDEAGAPVSFNEKDIPAMLEYLPADVRTELAGKIRGDAELNEGEE